MSDNTEVIVKKPKMTPAPQVSFEIDIKRHPLSKTLKKLDSHIDEAIAVVLKVLADPATDAKTRLVAAQYLLDTKIKLNLEMSKEVLTRQIAQVRLLQSQQPVKIKDVEEDDDSRPIVKFEPSVILSMERTTNL